MKIPNLIEIFLNWIIEMIDCIRIGIVDSVGLQTKLKKKKHFFSNIEKKTHALVLLAKLMRDY